MRDGEWIHYWDGNRDGQAEKSKHSFLFTTGDNKTIRFATFSHFDTSGKLIAQSWTRDGSHDDWLYSGRDTDGDGFFDYFCQYGAGGCQQISSCNLHEVQTHHTKMYEFVKQSAGNALQLAYATEIYTLADRMLNYCKFIMTRNGPRDERTNIRP